MKKLIIWCNQELTEQQQKWIEEAASEHELILKPGARSAPELMEVDVAFGQPPLNDVLSSPRIRWVQLSSAGYGNYDHDYARLVFAERSIVITKSSVVFAEPCAQHVLAFMLAQSRNLSESLANQNKLRDWPQNELRRTMSLLNEDRVVLVGYGSIAARLLTILSPFTNNIVGARRKPRGNEGIAVYTYEDPRLTEALTNADHVVNLLPGVKETYHFFDQKRLDKINIRAVFYNVGRGTTLDQNALADKLKKGELKAAWLDVTEPEPLPANHPLWQVPNCYITPHTAGGHSDERNRLVKHFLENLKRFEQGKPLFDQVWP